MPERSATVLFLTRLPTAPILGTGCVSLAERRPPGQSRRPAAIPPQRPPSRVQLPDGDRLPPGFGGAQFAQFQLFDVCGVRAFAEPPPAPDPRAQHMTVPGVTTASSSGVEPKVHSRRPVTNRRLGRPGANRLEAPPGVVVASRPALAHRWSLRRSLVGGRRRWQVQSRPSQPWPLRRGSYLTDRRRRDDDPVVFRPRFYALEWPCQCLLDLFPHRFRSSRLRE